MNTKQFALAVTLAATAFVAAGCSDRNSDCVNGKHPDGTVCTSSSSGGSHSGGFFRSGGFGGSHGGESGGS